MSFSSGSSFKFPWNSQRRKYRFSLFFSLFTCTHNRRSGLITPQPPQAVTDGVWNKPPCLALPRASSGSIRADELYDLHWPVQFVPWQLNRPNDMIFNYAASLIFGFIRNGFVFLERLRRGHALFYFGWLIYTRSIGIRFDHQFLIT